MQVHHMMLDAQLPADACGVAAWLRRMAERTLRRQQGNVQMFHCDADDLVSLLLQPGGGHRTVHAAAHGHSHF